jgi:hypothetical protein
MTTYYREQRIKKRTIICFLIIVFIHTSFAQNKKETFKLTPKIKTEVVQSVSNLLLNNYVFPDTAKLMSAFILAQLHKGNYKTITNPVTFTDVLSQDILSVLKDNHLQIQYNPAFEKQLLSANNDNATPQKNQTNYSNSNYGFRVVKILNGNIGYIEMSGFANPNTKSQEAVKAAMALVANTNTLIFDMRNNGGGSPEMVKYICSYFFQNKTHLMDWYNRSANTLTPFYTSPDTTEKRFLNKPIYILIADKTASAAEEFCYDLKNLNRATLVGQTTMGAAHGTYEASASNGFVLYIPYARMVNAITKTDWENTGVVPHISTGADKALEVVEEKIFQNLLTTVTDSTSKFELNWQYNLLKAHNNPVTINPETLQQFVGVYGERTFTLQNGELYYQRVGKPLFKLTPLTGTIMKGNDFFKIEFTKNDKGVYDEIIAYYQDGRIEKAKRTK